MKVLKADSEVKVILIIILITFGISSHSYLQLQSFQRDSTLQKYAYLKFSVFPFFYANLVNDVVWLTFHYEFRKKNSHKFTYNAVIDYHRWTYKLILNGVPVSVIPDNVVFYIRPQIRLYPGENAFKGFYIGLFPLYLYRDIKSNQTKGSYWGVGAVGGYQFCIRKKIPIEINSWIAVETGVVDKVDPWGNPDRGWDTDRKAFFELNVGLPVKRRK